MDLGSKKLVSVILVNWNGRRYLVDAFPSLYRQTYTPLEIILVDNASTDGTVEYVEAEHPQVLLIKNPENYGFCKANNQGIRIAKGSYILFMNPDVRLKEDFIEKAVQAAESEEQIGMVGGKLLTVKDPTCIDTTGIVLEKTRRAFDRGQGERDEGQFDQMEEVFGISGAACLCKRQMLEAIKVQEEYMDELFFAYKEDVDLSWRARLAGWKCVYTPFAVAYHDRTWSLGNRKQVPLWIRRHSLKNRYLMLLKNDRWSEIRPCLKDILWYELTSLGYILFREPHLFLALFQVIRWLPQALKKRAIIQKGAKVGKEDLIRWFYRFT